MLGHLSKPEAGASCRVCGKEMRKGEQFHYITGFGYVCHSCGIQGVECDSCGAKVRRMTLTVLRGRSLCLTCYRRERETGEKRAMREIKSADIQSALGMALESAPEGFKLIGLRLKTSSKDMWQAEYEREDIFEMRCS
ncbi:hypothetical protein HRbin01_00588 [archaeon HR01]|nr:hypothetical protein HRbin01_00588 [archaeon HR01]